MGHRDVLLGFLFRGVNGLPRSKGLEVCGFMLALALSFVGGCSSELDVLCDSASGLDGVVGTVFNRW